MDLKSIIVLCMYLFVICHGVNGGRVLSHEEDLELESELKILNKPPIKTFQNEVGDVIDCIDMYKQPAFDHPLLKNHKIQMAPSSPPKESTLNTSRTSDDEYSMTSDTEECPEGSIPIMRTTKEDLIRAKSFFELETTIHTDAVRNPRNQNAIVRTKVDSRDADRIICRGVQGNLNIFDPLVKVNQSSRNCIVAVHDIVQAVDYLSAGWLVSPPLYGDLGTRTYISWARTGTKPGESRGCFNHLCPGFVQMDHKFVLGGPLRPSVYGGNTLRYIVYRIYQDPLTGNWWVELPTKNRKLGYWPSELIPHLAKGPTMVKWGGFTQGYPDGQSPEMGSGRFPDGDYSHGCYVSNMLVVDADNDMVMPGLPTYETEIRVSDSRCFKVRDYGYNGDYGYSFLFGGPGGKCRTY